MRGVDKHDEPVEPAHMLCPITHAMFRDPVKVTSGFTYERKALEAFWSDEQKNLLDPRTLEVCPSSALFPDWDMRMAVGKFLDRHPTYLPRGWEDRSLPQPQAARPPLLEPPKVTHGPCRGNACCALAQLFLCPTFAIALAIAPSVAIVHYQCGWEGPGTHKDQLRLLGNLATLNPDVRKKLSHHSELDEWMAWVYRHLSCAETQQLGCKFLANLVEGGNETLPIPLQGRTYNVLAAIKRHPESGKVQRECFSCLRKLSGPSGSVEMLLSAMERYPRSASVQSHSAEILADISDENVTDVVGVAGLRGVELALRAMERHPQAQETQQMCVRLLVVLMRGGAFKDAALTPRTMPLILRAMEEHQACARLQQYSVTMMGALAAGNWSLVGERGVRLIVDAMQRHPAMIKLQTLSEAVLAELGVDTTKYFTVIHHAQGIRIVRFH